jgi:hypothetical protein
MSIGDAVVFVGPDSHKLRAPLTREVGKIRRLAKLHDGVTFAYVEFHRDGPHRPTSNGWWVDSRMIDAA